MKIKKILLVVLWIGFIGSIIDIVKMGISLIALRKAEIASELINNNVFWDLLTQIRLESIGVAICAGFLLLYYTIEDKD